MQFDVAGLRTEIVGDVREVLDQRGLAGASEALKQNGLRLAHSESERMQVSLCCGGARKLTSDFAISGRASANAANTSNKRTWYEFHVCTCAAKFHRHQRGLRSDAERSQ